MRSHMSAFISWPKRIYVLRSQTFTVFLVSSEFVSTEFNSIFWWVFGFQHLVLQAWACDTYKKRNMFLSMCKLKFSTNYDLFNI